MKHASVRVCLFSLLLLLGSMSFIEEAFGRIQDTTVDRSQVVADSIEISLSEGTVETDTLLAARIRRVLERVAGLEGVQLNVDEGVARLSGAVDQLVDRERAVELVSAFPDVLYVIDDVETSVEVEARLTPALERIQEYVNNTVSYFPIIGIACLVLIFFGLLAGIIDKLLPSFQRMGLSLMAGNLVVRIVRAVIWLVGLVLALDILGITALVGAVLGTAGLLGIAIGFAFQDIIENYLAGLLLSVRQPFGPNDHVKIGTEEGKVVRLTSRELVLMTLDGNHVRIPNAGVFKSTIYNYTLNPRRRFNFDAGIDVEEDLERVQRIGVETLRSMKSIMVDPGPFSLIRELGDFNVLVTFYAWVDQTTSDFSKTRSEAIRLVKNALDEAGVLMPEPIYNVRMQAVTRDLSSDARERLKKVAPELPAPREGDVSVERDIDELIEEDHQKSTEQNLLEQQ